VAPVDLKNVLENAVFQKDTVSWGPNSTFQFPLHGGTGNIWRRLAENLPSQNRHLDKKVLSLSLKDRKILFTDGTSESYDVLLNTIPLTEFVRLAGLESFPDSIPKLHYSSTHIVGLGLKGNPPEHLATKCWMYFPEDNCPFYRTTVFSNYSPNNVPDNERQWSLMMEVSESEVKKVDRDSVIEEVIQGAINTGLVSSRRQISHTWRHLALHGYPTPALNRNQHLFPLLNHLEDSAVYSRGRFGAWRYEVGNMDHSFMQGVEFANHFLVAGEELTLWYPQIVNGNHPSGRRR
jgi:protoporphyrinogen oxidase